MKPKLSILIPAKNEQGNAKIMLKILLAILEIPTEILVICDTENDNTIPVVKAFGKKHSNVRLIINNKGKGVANAIKSGVENSHGKYILIFAADEVGPVLAIEDMIYLMDQGCGLVSCTRYAHGGKRLGGSTTQALLSSIGNKIFNYISGISLTDSTTGIKMFKKNLFNKINPESNIGWAVVFEFSIKAQILGVKMGEVPIISIDRLYGGSSSFKLKSWLFEYLKWFVFGLTHIKRKNKRNSVKILIPSNIT